MASALLVLAGCAERGGDAFGFVINRVDVRRNSAALQVHVDQRLELSQEAQTALEHGVTLTIRLEMELRADNDLTLLGQAGRRFQIRFLPLSERFQLSEDGEAELRAFPRLRHALAAINRLDLRMDTGTLAPGGYELRSRIWLDKGSLPAPMMIPAWFSPRWHHDSEWSVWPFEIDA